MSLTPVGSGVQLSMYTGATENDTEHYLYTGDQIFLDDFIEERLDSENTVISEAEITEFDGIRLVR